jgi:hypothetical protein
MSVAFGKVKIVLDTEPQAMVYPYAVARQDWKESGEQPVTERMT